MRMASPVVAAKSSYLVNKTFERSVDDLVSEYLSVYQYAMK